MFHGIRLCENNTLSGSCFVDKMAVYVFIHKQHKLVICLKLSKIYGNGLTMLGNLARYTAYTNKFTFSQLKSRLGHLKDTAFFFLYNILAVE